MKTKQEQFKEKLVKLLEEEMSENDDLSSIAFAVADFYIEVSRKLNEELERMSNSSNVVH